MTTKCTLTIDIEVNTDDPSFDIYLLAGDIVESARQDALESIRETARRKLRQIDYNETFVSVGVTSYCDEETFVSTFTTND